MKNMYPEIEDFYQDFVRWYNFTHLHSGIKFITPNQRHHGLDKKIIENRIKVYEEARAKNPSRWSRGIRDWILPEIVALNPIRGQELSLVIKEQ